MGQKRLDTIKIIFAPEILEMPNIMQNFYFLLRILFIYSLAA